MSSSNDDSRKPGSGNEEENPFVSFRRYADEQLSSLLQGITGLPSKIGTPRPQWPSSNHENGNQVAQDAWDRRMNLRDSDLRKEHCDDTLPRRDGTSDDRPLHEATDSPYMPRTRGAMYYLGPQHPFPDRPFPGSPIPLASDDTASSAWPTDYLLSSPYSPVVLEQQEHFREHGQKWRDAFEDLLNTQEGIAMQPRKKTSHDSNKPGEWLTSLFGRKSDQQPMTQDDKRKNSVMRATIQCPAINLAEGHRDSETDTAQDGEVTDIDIYNWMIRSARRSGKPEEWLRLMFGSDNDRKASTQDDEQNDSVMEAATKCPAFRFVGDHRNPKNESTQQDEEDEELTELDLYERFLGLQCDTSPQKPLTDPPGPKQSATQVASDVRVPPPKDETKPSILSTLTTTSRTTLPDGTVHTKICMKRSFSDGREESSETVHTTAQASQDQSQSSRAVDDDTASSKQQQQQDRGLLQEANGRRNRGWFWS
ncbi:hypothetical protein MMC09_001182 [Bachmanniomyces sp. S44760]|nr:hypothetical protein [Bachmanniomyces sp. S44760]